MNYVFSDKVLLRAPALSFTGYDPDKIETLLKESFFRNALLLASKDLYAQLEKKAFDYSSLSSREHLTIWKYYNRMCFRPVPFGAFASFGLIGWGDDDHIKLQPLVESRLHFLEKQNNDVGVHRINPETILRLNPLLYRFDREFRFVKSVNNKGGQLLFSLDALTYESFYERMFRVIKKQPMTVRELHLWIANCLNCSEVEANNYITFLTDQQILFTPAFGSLIARKGLRSGNVHKIPEGCSTAYAALERNAHQGSLDQRDQEELSKAIELLQRMAVPVSITPLTRFIKAFRSRFDLEKVPLLTALDPDAGIPYEDHLNAAGAETNVSWNHIQQSLMKRWPAGIGNHNGNILLDDQMLNELQSDSSKRFPPGITVIYRKCGDNLLIESAGGATSTAIAGRFTLFSDEVYAHCSALAKTEQKYNEQVIFADIDQRSHAYVDHINMRRQVYGHVIPLNTSSTDNNQLLPEDLLLSVRNEQLILESVRLKKRVIPRLSSAYNYLHNGLGIFCLLCDLQFQDIHAHLTFELGNFFPGLSYYPRVTYGTTILGLATWHIKEEDLKPIINETDGTLAKTVRQLRAKFNLPQFVLYGNGDQQLVIDLCDMREIQFFMACVKNLKSIILKEYLMPDKTVRESGGSYAAQYVCTLYNKTKVYEGTTITKGKNKIQRTYLPGGDWLYIQLFCTPESSNEILTKLVDKFIKKEKRSIKEWFFIRYNEDGHHLRLRFRVNPELQSHLLESFNKMITKGGMTFRIKKLKVCTYERELERYGTDAIEEVETLFCIGSRLAILLLLKSEDNESGEQLLRDAMIVAHFMVNCFFDSYEEQLRFVKICTDNFFKEFKIDKDQKLELDAEYRPLTKGYNKAFENLFADKKIAATCAALKDQIKILNTQKMIDVAQITADIIHMQINRQFKIDQRYQEMRIYYFLSKLLLTIQHMPLLKTQYD